MADESKAAEKPKMTDEEKHEARGRLLRSLLLILVGVLILYFSFELGIGVLSFAIWLFTKALGGGAG